MIGRYLDTRVEYVRDRIIMGQGWNFGTEIDDNGDRCMVGHAEDDKITRSGRTIESSFDDDEYWRRHNGGFSDVGYRFDAFAKRVGLARAVQLVKNRAARNNTPNTDLPEMRSVEACVP